MSDVGERVEKITAKTLGVDLQWLGRHPTLVWI